MVQIFNIDTDEEHDDSLSEATDPLIQKKLSPLKARVIAISKEGPRVRHTGRTRHNHQQVSR